MNFSQLSKKIKPQFLPTFELLFNRLNKNLQELVEDGALVDYSFNAAGYITVHLGDNADPKLQEIADEFGESFILMCDPFDCSKFHISAPNVQNIIPTYKPDPDNDPRNDGENNTFLDSFRYKYDILPTSRVMKYLYASIAK